MVRQRSKASWCGSTALVVAAALVLPSPAFALDLADGFTLSPFISEKAEYHSNIFQAPSRAQHDVIFKTIPGLLAEYTTGPVSLSAGYRLEILRFLDLTSQDTEHHFAVGQFKLELPRLLINFRDDFVRTSDPPNSELTGRVESQTNTLHPEVEYKLTDRFAVGTDYTWTRVSFEQRTFSTILDRDEHLIGGSVFWKFLPKTDLRFSYQYGQKDFDVATDRDVTRNIALIGLRGDLTAKLASTFRIGYESREPRRSNRKGYDGLILGGDWIYNPTERTTISLLTDRSVVESTFGSTLYFVATTATLVAEHRFVPKLSGNLRLTAGDNSYPTKETVGGRTKFRNDATAGWGAGVDYDIQKWLRVGLEYLHTLRDSNFREFNFADDRVTGTITLQF